MKRRLDFILLFVGLVLRTVTSSENVMKRAVPAQQDEATEEQTNRLDLEQVEIKLEPAGNVDLMEGADITFECAIKHKPRNSQIQWYYLIRNPVDNSFDNFTIIANEAATVNKDKYRVWTTPPGVYTLQIDELGVNDSGEYCCFLYVSYSESYREITALSVHAKGPPPTTSTTTTTTERPAPSSAANSQYYPSYTGESAGQGSIDDIIEEVVEHDMEEKLGKRLNISMIKSNPEARTLIHNATEEIKSLINFADSSGLEFKNDTTKMTISKKIQGASSQVKTVVTTLIHRISNVDSQLARALAPHYNPAGSSISGQGRSGISYVSGQDGGVPNWRTLYNQYKRGRDPSPQAPTTSSEQISNTPEPNYRYAGADDERLEIEEEQTKHINSNQRTVTSSAHKCQYQIVINEFDPSQCPKISSNRAAPASIYSESDNRKAAAYTQEPIGNDPQYPNDQLSRLENQLQEEMANSKMVNKTVLMHDGMLLKTEKMMEQQTENLTKLHEQVRDLKSKLSQTEAEKHDMEDKLTDIMLNILEVNKRLDVAMSNKHNGYNGKEIEVLSAAETVTCERHENVTFYQDCAEMAREENAPSGVYYIRPMYSACPIPVWCDMDTYPGGWTVVQRREIGAIDFNKPWDEYRKGFGHVTSEHWLGNDNLFLLSNQQEYMMRVDLWDFYDSRVFAEYRTFKVDGERDGYKLSIGNYTGTAGDGLKTHNKQKFSTSDRDQDLWKDYHCAYEWEGGWWFTNCWSSYLNGPYYNVSNPPYNGISWRQWKEEQLFRSEMKIRPVYHILSDDEAAAADDGEKLMETDAAEETLSAESGEESQRAQGDQPRQDDNNRRKQKLNMAMSSP